MNTEWPAITFSSGDDQISIRANTGDRDKIAIRGKENILYLRDELTRICQENGFVSDSPQPEKQWFLREAMTLQEITRYVNTYRLLPGEFQTIPSDNDRCKFYVWYYAEEELP